MDLHRVISSTAALGLCMKAAESPTVNVHSEQPSLEEAHEEALYKYNHHMTNQIAPSLATGTRHRRTISGQPTRAGALAKPMLCNDLSAAAPQASPSTRSHPHRNACSKGYGDGWAAVSAGGSIAAATADGNTRELAMHLGMTSSGGMDARANMHKRYPSDGMHRIHTAASVAADESIDSSATGLEFTAEIAAGMSLQALRELSVVLSHIISTRNKELVTLLERRDELTHERGFRQATVTALVAQVGKSQYVRDAGKKK